MNYGETEVQCVRVDRENLVSHAEKQLEVEEMRSRWYLFLVLLGTMFFAAPLFAVGTPQPGIGNPGDDGEGNNQPCYLCKGSYNFDTGESTNYCGKPESGGWGSSECEVGEYDTDRFYCISYGETCCVN